MYQSIDNFERTRAGRNLGSSGVYKIKGRSNTGEISLPGGLSGISFSDLRPKNVMRMPSTNLSEF
jgi:hypothetical protein